MKWVVAVLCLVAGALLPLGEEADVAPVPYLPPAITVAPARPVALAVVKATKCNSESWRVPPALIAGILKTETRSTLLPGKRVKYVDRRRGALGERGPTQIRPETFAQYAKPGEHFADLEHNMTLALTVTERILLSYHEQTGSWKAAVAAWNAGPGNVRAGYHYQARVYRAANI